MYPTGTEPLSLPRFPVEFGAIPAIKRDHEIQPNKNAADHDNY